MVTCIYCYNDYASNGGLTRHLSFCPVKRSRDEAERMRAFTSSQSLIKPSAGLSDVDLKKIIGALTTEMRGQISDATKQFSDAVKEVYAEGVKHAAPHYTINGDVNIMNIYNVDQTLTGFKHKLLIEIDRDPSAWSTIESSKKRLCAIKDSAFTTGSSDDQCMLAALSGADFAIDPSIPEAHEDLVSERLYNGAVEIDHAAIQAIKAYMPASVVPDFEAATSSVALFALE